jgi:arsenate reductase (glutaredoxin)
MVKDALYFKMYILQIICSANRRGTMPAGWRNQKAGQAMNIQIFGTKKCQDSRKAERYFKERAIPFQYVDLTVRGLSKGELDRVKASVGLENLIDKTGKEYARLNLRFMVHQPENVLLEHPLLLKTPLVRNGRQATVGYHPEVWQDWE